MIRSQLCPSRSQIRDYLLGQLTSDDSVSSHLEQCDECAAVASQLDTEADSMIADLRADLDDGHRDNCDLSGTDLGDYELIRHIGAGGMGTVYQAWHTHLKKHVAIKILPHSRSSSLNALLRFRTEMEAAARVDHAHVVRAMDAREVGGRHLLVMEHVDGIDLSRLAKLVQPLPIGDACEIVRQAALGIESIHAAGMVHRDIKPSNLILSSDGIVKVVDLGLASLQAQEAIVCNAAIDDTAPGPDGETLSQSRVTRTGQRLGTAKYAAPEQALGNSEADHRADIFSLGCTLFYLLTGELPYEQPWDEDSAASKEGVSVRNHCKSAPKVLDDLLRAMTCPSASHRMSSARAVADTLESIVLKHDEPPLAELADDVDLAGLRAIRDERSARKCSHRSIQRRRYAAVLGVIALLMIGVVALIIASVRSSSDPAAISVESSIVDTSNPGPDIVQLDIPHDVLARVKRIFMSMDLSRASIRTISGSRRYMVFDAVTGDLQIDEYDPEDSVPRYYRTESGQLADLNTAEALSVEEKEEVSLRMVRFTGTRMAQILEDGQLFFFDFDEKINNVVKSGMSEVNHLALSGDTKRLAALGGNEVTLWDFETQTRIWHSKCDEAISVCVSQDGALVAIITVEGQIVLTHWGRNYQTSPLSNSPVQVANFAWNAPILGYADSSGFIGILDCHTMNWLRDFKCDLNPNESFIHLSFAEDLMGFVAATSEGRLHRFKVDWSEHATESAPTDDNLSMKFVRSLIGHDQRVTSLAFSPDGRKLVSGGDDRTIRIFDVATGELDFTHQRHSSFVRDVSFFESENLLLSASEDQTIKAFAWPAMVEQASVTMPRRPISIHPIPGTTKLAVGTVSGGLVVADIKDASSQKDLGEISGGTFEIQAVITSEGQLVAGDGHGWLHVIDLATLEQTKLLKDYDRSFVSMAYYEPLGLLAAGSHDGTLVVWKWPEATVVHKWKGHAAPVSALCFSPTGEFLASGCRAGGLMLWSTDDYILKAEAPAHDETIRDIKFSPDGRIVATASHDRTIKLWETPAFRPDDAVSE